jgi:hypothetical protein
MPITPQHDVDHAGEVIRQRQEKRVHKTHQRLELDAVI